MGQKKDNGGKPPASVGEKAIQEDLSVRRSNRQWYMACTKAVWTFYGVLILLHVGAFLTGKYHKKAKENPRSGVRLYLQHYKVVSSACFHSGHHETEARHCCKVP